MKKKYMEAELAYQTVKHELELTAEELCRVKEALKCHKNEHCVHCPELEREVGAYRKKLEYNKRCIKSVVSILCKNNGSEDLDRNQSSQKASIDKAYKLVSQMLLDSTNSEKDTICDVRSGTRRLQHDSVESLQMTPGKKRKKHNKRTAKADEFNIEDGGSDIETLYYGATLAPESLPVVDRVVCPDLGMERVPETSCSQYPADLEESVIDLNERIDNIQTTPKKQVLHEQVTQKYSPVLGGCSRKSTHKTAHCDNSATIVGSPDASAVPLQTLIQNGKSDNCVGASDLITNCEDYVDRSPSLLKIQSGISNPVATGPYKMEDGGEERKRNENHKENVSRPLKHNRENKNIQADFWKLKPVPNTNINNGNPVVAVNRKLKQTILTLHSFPKKQDICTLKEFNGGVRPIAIENSLLVDQINGNCDDETSLKLAIQRSLNDKENIESVSSESKCSGDRNWRIVSAEDKDDFVLEGNSASSSRMSPKQKRVYAAVLSSVSRKTDITSKSTTRKKKKIQCAVGRKDMDETLFVPQYASTLQDVTCTYGTREVKRVPETEELCSEQNFKDTTHAVEMKDRMESELVKEHNCSFDRVPDKVSTSPNYKYRRDALRKREARQKLDGWECQQCRNYYAVTCGGADPSELKRHLKLCSRHRDKYSFQSRTPLGYWDVNFSNTEESMLENILSVKKTPFPKD
ncbi:uncharacterized protein LOC110828509 isoform X2 [Zootermopsis nevadensis]|nr:uncharacterized protein LOC110828509 isoform X2 [Zootermopsis nevadensis]